MDTEKFYRASEIISYPKRRGLLPFSETHFYRLLKSGKFPEPDAKAGATNLWSGTLLYEYLRSKH